MKKFLVYILLFVSLFLHAQDESIYEELLREVVEVENPVYKPVIGGGIGLMGFFGDVKNTYGSLLFNMPAYKVNVSTFVDEKHVIKANFTFLTGLLNANERSYTDVSRNLNFESNINSFGVNLEYGFSNFFKEGARMSPFISAGLEIFLFSSKTDAFRLDPDPDNPQDFIRTYYNYWSDGTIRDLPETEANIFQSNIIKRDYVVDTDLRGERDVWGYTADYSQNSLAIPIDIGLDFIVSDRFKVRLGTSLHYTFTDYLDHLAPNNILGLEANSRNDIFTYTYATIHLDLFSEAKQIEVRKLFVDVDYDMALLEDLDNDGVMDWLDECLDTPMNLVTDSTGCPVDDDNDGVPNYLDLELDTPPGAYVNKDGVQISEEELIALLDNSSAVPRKDIDLYIRKIDDITYSKYYGISNLDIPDKFRVVDLNGDGYISFDEVLDTIDGFFEFDSELTTEDIYELNEFFFAQ